MVMEKLVAFGIIFLIILYFLFHKKRGNREMQEVDESNDQMQNSDDSAEGYEYEVFLSFRGEDTRKKFTDHLHSYLTNLRIRTFRDNEKLRVGEEIEPNLKKAMEQSKILIPILSKQYASSKWCLLELAYMFKCVDKSNKGAIICPIFYEVTPTEVRNQTGSFEQAFLQHKEKFDEKTVNQWKESLRKVTALKGWEKDEIADGSKKLKFGEIKRHEAELIKIVATKVLVELKKKHVKVTEELVDMGHHEDEMMRLLDLDRDDTRIIGIVGMGGIGKTTIAKVVYNRLCSEFNQCCSFLENIGENNNFECLQEQLMFDILKQPSKGLPMDENTFKRVKALIVLDDVDDISQLTGIFGKHDWFGRGSRIIVTTRNSDIFKKLEGVQIYKPRELDSKNSLRLFCKHAFRRDRPLPGYEDVSMKVASKVAGLPLSLVVLGSLLATQEIEVWVETVEKLKDILPYEVRKRLKISYDKLENNVKEIFLDIACHFSGSSLKKDFACYMWADCKFYPASGVQVLISLSLVEKTNNGFKMHDQLRDLGREIARNEDPNNPGKHKRLWSLQDAQDVLCEGMGTELVQTLALDDRERDCCEYFPSEGFKGLSNLRYLNLQQCNLEGDFKGLLFNLRWFRWQPANDFQSLIRFCPRKLVVLDLSYSNISDGWGDRLQIKNATNLRVLDLSHCHRLEETPDLSTLQKLERLNLEGCSSLVRIVPTIIHLKSLTFVDVTGCKCALSFRR